MSETDWIRCEGGACVEYRTEGDTVTIRSTVTAEEMRVTVAEWEAFVAGLVREERHARRLNEASMAAENARLRQDNAAKDEQILDLEARGASLEDERDDWMATCRKAAKEREVTEAEMDRRLIEAWSSRDAAIAERDRQHRMLLDATKDITELVAEAAVLRHRDRRTQAVVEAAVAWRTWWADLFGDGTMFIPENELANAVDAYENGPTEPPTSLLPAEQAPVVHSTGDGLEAQGGAQRAASCAECEVPFKWAACPDCGARFCGEACAYDHRTLGTCPKHADGQLPAEVPWTSPVHTTSPDEADGWRAIQGFVNRLRRDVELMQTTFLGAVPPLTEVLLEPATGGIIPAGTRFAVEPEPAGQWVDITKWISANAKSLRMPDFTDEERAAFVAEASTPERTEVTDAKDQTQDLHQREDPVPGPDRRQARPGDMVTAAPQQGTDPGVPLPDVQGLAPDVTTVDRTEGLDAAIEAAKISALADIPWLRIGRVATVRAINEWLADQLRAASPLIERAALLKRIRSLQAEAKNHAEKWPEPDWDRGYVRGMERAIHHLANSIPATRTETS